MLRLFKGARVRSIDLYVARIGGLGTVETYMGGRAELLLDGNFRLCPETAEPVDGLLIGE